MKTEDAQTLALFLYDLGINVGTGVIQPDKDKEKPQKRPYAPVRNKKWNWTNKKPLSKSELVKCIKIIEAEEKELIVGVYPGKITRDKFKGFYFYAQDFDEKDLIGVCNITYSKCKKHGLWLEKSRSSGCNHLYGMSIVPIHNEKRHDIKLELFGDQFIAVYGNFDGSVVPKYDLIPTNSALSVWNGCVKTASEHFGIESKVSPKPNDVSPGTPDCISVVLDTHLKANTKRNETALVLFHYYHKFRGMGINEASFIIKSWNQENIDPLSDIEINSIKKSVARSKKSIGCNKIRNLGYCPFDEAQNCSYFKDPRKNKEELLRNYGVFDYNDSGVKTHINCAKLGDLLIAEHGSFIVEVESRDIFRNNDGCYTNAGVEQEIRGLAQFYMDDWTTQHRRSEVLEYIRSDRNLFVNKKQLNPPFRYINLKNGIYDVDTKTLLSHDTDIGDFYFINQVPVDYDPSVAFEGSESEKFHRGVIHEIDLPVVQEWFGFNLYRRYFIHKSLMQIGSGRNGKGCTLRQLSALLGKKNVSSKDLMSIAGDKYALADLRGKLANICGDIGDEKLRKTDNFKKATGEDMLDAQHKYGHPFSFENYAKMAFSANRLPATPDKTKAFFSRWVMIFYPYSFEGCEDTNLTAKITTDLELTATLNWALDGLHRLLENEKFSDGKTSIDIEKEYELRSNPMEAFLTSNAVAERNETIEKSEFREKYFSWCDENGIYKPSENKILGMIRDVRSFAIVESGKGSKLNDGTRPNVYKNISWLENKEKMNSDETEICPHSPSNELQTTLQKRR